MSTFENNYSKEADVLCRKSSLLPGLDLKVKVTSLENELERKNTVNVQMLQPLVQMEKKETKNLIQIPTSLQYSTNSELLVSIPANFEDKSTNIFKIDKEFAPHL